MVKDNNLTTQCNQLVGSVEGNKTVAKIKLFYTKHQKVILIALASVILLSTMAIILSNSSKKKKRMQYMY